MRSKRTLPLVVVAGWLAAATLVPAADLPNDRETVEHALNRLTFGPRAGEVERVRQLGLTAWIDAQLAPRRIDDAALERRLPAMPARPAVFATQQDSRRFGRESVQVLAAAKLIRAVHSERQLEEVLVDFWFNHFNVFAGKGRTSLYIPEYEREAIRPHVFGRFRDMLGATAKSPAMLFYLDNWLSADPGAADRAQQTQQRRAGRALRRPGEPRRAGRALSTRQPEPAADTPVATGRRRGLNENYARELLELHTLGVDGGYTQDDIIHVARTFTGWTIDRPQQAGGFRFAPALHDRGEKLVLGHQFKEGGGVDEGERVLDIVAAHPSTARHIATKLARRFVSDDPPAALVDRVAARFRDTDGDLREVVRALITSPEFASAEARRAKVKTPLEFVASAMRATGREVTDARPLLRGLQQLGMMPYMCQPPTGYDDEAATWVSAGALVSRMNLAQQIAPAQAAVIGGPAFQRR